MPSPSASARPADAAKTARLLRGKSVLLPSDFAKLDQEAKKRAITVTDEVSLDAIRDMRDALAKAKADGIEYREFVKTVGPKLHAQWGVDSPQLKTVFVNNVQQAANQAIIARLNKQRGKYPYWTLDIVNDEVTSATCGYFITHPIVLPAGHPWWAKNAPMRHHRCRTTLRGLTAAEARKIGITKTPPDWPAEDGWGGSAPLGEYKANMGDFWDAANRAFDRYMQMGKKVTADIGQGDVHTDGPVKVRKMAPITTEKRKALPDQQFALPETRQYPIHDAAHARNAMARLEQNKSRISPDQYAKAKRNILKAYRKFGIKSGSTVGGGGRRLKHLKVHFAPSATHIEIRHMSDRVVQCASVEIDKTLLDDGPVEAGPPKLVWNQLNKLGAFRGHPSGPFEITEQINSEIERNFRATQNKKIPIDFEHASEQTPTEGTIPTEGAPAQGWIHDVQNRGRAGLWGLVEWLEPARSYIRQGKYKFFSPAIRFGSKDRVTGQPIGARMTSGALTNNPFLDGLMPVAASDRSPDATGDTRNMGDYAYSMAEVMPKLRACLFGPDSLATTEAVHNRIGELKALVEEFRASNPDADIMTAKHSGIELGAMLRGLRDTMNMHLGITVPELLDVVEGMIAEAIGIHEDEMHEEIPPSSREMGNTTMADQETVTKLRDAETKLAMLMSEKQVLANENQTLTTKVAGLELQLADRNSKVTTLEAENKLLRDNEAKRAEADETAAIELAFATYKDAHKLTDAHKKQMLLTYRHDRATFDTIYPPVAPDQRHLMRSIAPAGARPSVQQGAADARAIVGAGKSPEDMIQLADKYQKEGLSREAALSKAYNESVAMSRRNGAPAAR